MYATGVDLQRLRVPRARSPWPGRARRFLLLAGMTLLFGCGLATAAQGSPPPSYHTATVEVGEGAWPEGTAR